MSTSPAYERKMYIKQSGNHTDTQYNIDILLLCLNVCTTEQSLMDSLSEKGKEGGRTGGLTTTQESCLFTESLH